VNAGAWSFLVLDFALVLEKNDGKGLGG